jgi:hypothetical protein
MIEEFKKGVHLSKEDKGTERYWRYVRNRNESHAFQAGCLAGLFCCYIFLKKTSMNRMPKIIYSVNLFLAVHIFTYEIYSKMYTDKIKVYEMDKLLDI